MICIWIVLTQVFTDSILARKPQRKGPEVLFVSLLKNSVTRSPWIAEKASPVKLAPNLFSFSSLNSLIVSSRVAMLHNVNNFDGPMQKNSRLIYFLLEDVQYLILLQIKLMATSLTLILCTIKLILHHFPYYLQRTLSLFC